MARRGLMETSKWNILYIYDLLLFCSATMPRPLCCFSLTTSKPFEMCTQGCLTNRSSILSTLLRDVDARDVSKGETTSQWNCFENSEGLVLLTNVPPVKELLLTMHVKYHQRGRPTRHETMRVDVEDGSAGLEDSLSFSELWRPGNWPKQGANSSVLLLQYWWVYVYAWHIIILGCRISSHSGIFRWNATSVNLFGRYWTIPRRLIWVILSAFSKLEKDLARYMDVSHLSQCSSVTTYIR